MTDTSFSESAENIRGDDIAAIGAVIYGAVFWGWPTLEDLVSSVGISFWWSVLFLVVWGCLVIGLTQRWTGTWLSTLLFGILTAVGYYLLGAPISAAILGGALLYLFIEGSDFHVVRTHPE